VAAEVLAPMVGYLVRYDAAVGHAEDLRQGLERCAELYLYGGIVEGHKWLTGHYPLIEYPCAGGGYFGVYDAIEAIDHIGCCHAATFAVGEQGIILEIDIATEIEGICEAIGTD